MKEKKNFQKNFFEKIFMIIWQIYDKMFQLGRLFFVNKIHSVTVGSQGRRVNNNDIFGQIVGYPDIKDLLELALLSEYSTSILLSGIPGIGKSLFLKCIENSCHKHSIYLDCSLMTKAGLRDLLFENRNRLKILLLDEISRLKKIDQEILLNLLQDGRIIDTRSGNHRELKFSFLKVFATCNELSKLIEPLRDRFDRYDLPQYTFEDFNSICNRVVKVKDHHLKQKIISAVWDEMGSRNVRDVINASRYISTYDDLEKYITIKKKYSIRS